MSEPRSVAFDRAADFYDTTRSLAPEAKAKFEELLIGEVRSREPVLEVGVGTGRVALPVHDRGLQGDDSIERLDAAFAEHAAVVRELDPVIERWAIPPGDFLKFFEGGVFSWTWQIPEEERTRVAEAVRPWAAERFGSLDEPHWF